MLELILDYKESKLQILRKQFPILQLNIGNFSKINIFIFVKSDYLLKI